jgi:phosphatidylglycerophosphate synthase
VSRLTADLMQPENSHGAMSIAPILILLPAPNAPIETAWTEPPFDGDTRVLGLDLLQRTIITARRAGYGQIFSLARNRALPPAIITIPDWSHLGSVFVPSQTAPLLIMPATILSEIGWLERLAEMRIEAAAWAVSPNRIVMLTAAAVPDAIAVLHTDGGAYDLMAVQDRLAHRFGSPAEIPVGIDPIIVAAPTDVRIAERRLLAKLVKDTDGFMARHVERPLSLQVSRYLASTAVTPNQISMVSIVVGLSGAPFFLSTFSTWQTVGALLLLAHSILDGCDGELARLKFQESRWGGVLDFWGDNIVHMATFTCMAAGWALSVDAVWPLLLGATAVLGNLSSASFVYWRLMRDKNGSGPLFTSVTTTPDRRLARLLDAASRRDFIYLVLVLALFGKSNWFLLLASLGAPMFFFFLVFLAVRERPTNMPTTSDA